jgi:hypothetical protein
MQPGSVRASASLDVVVEGGEQRGQILADCLKPDFEPVS